MPFLLCRFPEDNQPEDDHSDNGNTCGDDNQRIGRGQATSEAPFLKVRKGILK